MRALWIAAAATVMVSACAGPRTTPDTVIPLDEAEVVTYEFDPMIIRSGIDDEGAVWTAETDLPSLFHEANDYLNADDFENAIELYEIVLEESASPDYLRASNYNMGLAHEGLEEWLDAAPYYQNVINEWPSSDDAAWSYYRLAECLAQLGEFRPIPMLMERVLMRTGLTHVDRMEAHLRWANALLELREFPDAEAHYDRVLMDNEAATLAWNPDTSPASARPLPNHDAIIAQAYFGRARVYHELFLDIQFVLPQERITRDLVDKTQLFDQAQDAYLDCVRTANPYWSPAAGYMVGQLYEDYYADLLASEVPDDFNALELEIYFEELRALIEPAMERAMSVYEHNLAMSYRLGSSNVWVDDTLASIERVQSYLGGHQGWEDEQELVVHRRHPRSAFYTEHLVFRSERHRLPRD